MATSMSLEHKLPCADWDSRDVVKVAYAKGRRKYADYLLLI
jgi:hypothetical protein